MTCPSDAATLYGRFASTGEVALYGTGPGLAALCRFIRSSAPGQLATLELAASGEDDEYDADLVAIDLESTSGPTRVSVSGARLVVGGSTESMRRLANNIDGLALSRAVREGPAGRRFGPHWHVQPDLDGTYVAKDSCELVICRLLDD